MTGEPAEELLYVLSTESAYPIGIFTGKTHVATALLSLLANHRSRRAGWRGTSRSVPVMATPSSRPHHSPVSNTVNQQK